MTEIWFQAALWLGLALIATILSIYLRIATALSEIVVGTIAQLIIGALLGASILAGDASWVQFLSGAGAILLTFLAGAELDRCLQKTMETGADYRSDQLFPAVFPLCGAGQMVSGLDA